MYHLYSCGTYECAIQNVSMAVVNIIQVIDPGAKGLFNV